MRPSSVDEEGREIPQGRLESILSKIYCQRYGYKENKQTTVHKTQHRRPKTE